MSPNSEQNSAVKRKARYLPSLFLGLAAILLVVSIFLPYWQITLFAPQYPGGLKAEAYVNRLEGDIEEIDRLNHYIGMHPLEHAARFERSMSIIAIATFALLVLAAIFVHNKWAALLALPAVLLPATFLLDLYLWLRNFGLNLDPSAPLSSSIEPFIPAVLGRSKIAQFGTLATLQSGAYLALAAALLTLMGLFFHRRAYKD